MGWCFEVKRCYSDGGGDGGGGGGGGGGNVGGGCGDELEDNDLLKNRRAQWLEVESKKVMKPLSRATQTPFFLQIMMMMLMKMK